MALLEVEHLTFTYPQCSTPAVRDVSFRVEAGEFIAVCGATGSGKSTLLRLLKRELAPLGQAEGRILLNGTPQTVLSPMDSAYAIGYVMQRPEQQIVTDKVWHELAFGLENMHLPQPVIARRIAEMAAYFGISDWFDKPVSTLSGGQKQLLNLAAVMVMKPRLLILDEPTAQLDPIAASDFIATLHKLNRELGLTVIITEHRLEEVIPVCDRLMVLEQGSLLQMDVPRRVIARLRSREELLCFMPSASRLYCALADDGPCPLDVREGRQMIARCFPEPAAALPPEPAAVAAPVALSFRDVSFRYSRSGTDVLQGLSCDVQEGEILCILGGNGSGKTTMLRAAAGLIKPYMGEIRVFGKRLKEYRNQSLYRHCLTMLPQDVQTVFLRNTVREELAEAGEGASLLPFDFTSLMDKHPYDLSGGEQQLLALAKVLGTQPRLLLLDEPTKGIDAAARIRLSAMLKALKAQGMTLVLVTHDVEFAARCADRCALFFRGSLISTAAPRSFFGENSFYTTAVNRMTSGILEGAVLVEDVLAIACEAQKGGKA